MKKVLPLLLIVSALEIYGIVFCGEQLFKDRYVNLSEITILSNNMTSSGKYRIVFTMNEKQYETYSFYNYSGDKTGTLRYNYSDNYLGLSIFYIVFTVCFGVYFILRTIDLLVIYNSYNEIGKRFRSHQSIFPNSYADFYNSIDSYDLTPLKDKFKSFWGY